MNKSFAILAFLATTLAASTVMAQALPEVKTGDKLTWLYTPYQENARQIVPLPAKEEIAVLTINPGNGDREYAYTDGTKLVTNNQFGPKVAKDKRIFIQKEIFNVLQGDPVVGQTWSFEADQKVVNPRFITCPLVEFRLTATVLSGPTVTIRVGGVDTSVKTLFIKQEGMRYYGSCSSGPGCAATSACRLFSPQVRLVPAEYQRSGW